MAGQKVTIVEVGPRDGLQNEKDVIATDDKLQLIELLADAGCSRIEATAFVSPKWVPQMADHDEVMRRARRRPNLTLLALGPNEKGAHAAIEAGAQEIAVFASASETFASRNTNCTIVESIERFRPVIALAQRQRPFAVENIHQIGSVLYVSDMSSSAAGCYHTPARNAG